MVQIVIYGLTVHKMHTESIDILLVEKAMLFIISTYLGQFTLVN